MDSFSDVTLLEKTLLKKVHVQYFNNEPFWSCLKHYYIHEVLVNK